MPRCSLAEYFPTFDAHAAETAYVYQRGYRTYRWTYRQIRESAAQFARELGERGIGQGDRVLLWGPNCAEWVAAFWGCVLRGAVAVPMDAIATPDFAARVAAQSGARLAVCGAAQTLARSIPVISFEDLPTLIAPHSGMPYSAPDLAPSDLLQIVFTSGTTADPKGVVISHGNVLANLEPLETQIRAYLKYERFVHPIRFLNLLPLSHVFGQFLGLFLPAIMGGTVVFQDSLNPSEIVRTIRRERISVVVTVPHVLDTLQQKIEREVKENGWNTWFDKTYRATAQQRFLRRMWRFRRIHRQFGWKFWAFISGGAALAPATEEFWGRMGFAVIQGYGLTETTSLISVNHPFHLGKGSIGKVLEGRELKLDANGEILVRGAGVATGYWSGGQVQPVAGEEGWYRTGDLGALGADGTLYFKGRKKDVIVTPAGMNIYPEDLEAALRQQPEVRDCVVVGLSLGGNAQPCAVLLLREAGDAAAVVRAANEALADYQKMRQFYAWPDRDFPRTPTQKPKRAAILEAVTAHFGQRPPAPGGDALAEIIGRVTGQTPPQGAQDLDADLNLDSIARVSLLSALEDRYQIDLSETSFATAKTVGDIERLVRGESTAQVHFDYPAWVQRWPVTWIRFAVHYLLARPSVFLLGWPRIEGRENLSDVQGPVLVVCNHISHVDVGYVLTALPAHLRHKLAVATGGEALQELRTPPADRNWLLRPFDRIAWLLGVSLLNLFPLPRQAGFRQSFAYAGECVDRGFNVLVFPEGRHTEDGKMLPFRSGIGILAQQLNIPVVPLRIDGLFEFKQAGKHWVPPGRVRVRIGKLVRYDSQADAASIAQELQGEVASL
jgi:long-chain acyl-CoA synthetase